MSTRAIIAVMTDDQTCQFVSCRRDGYIAWIGFVLYLYYTTNEQAQALLAPGILGAVGTTLRDCEYACRDWNWDWSESAPQTLTGTLSEVMELMEEQMHFSPAEYAYLHDGTKWLVFVYGMWHSKQASEHDWPEPWPQEVPRGGWRYLAAAVTAELFFSWFENELGILGPLEVGPELSISEPLDTLSSEVALKRKLYKCTVTQVSTGESYEETDPVPDHAVHKALVLIPEEWLPSGVTRYDIGVNLSTHCSFSDLTPQLIPPNPADVASEEHLVAFLDAENRYLERTMLNDLLGT